MKYWYIKVSCKKNNPPQFATLVANISAQINTHYTFSRMTLNTNKASVGEWAVLGVSGDANDKRKFFKNQSILQNNPSLEGFGSFQNGWYGLLQFDHIDSIKQEVSGTVYPFDAVITRYNLLLERSFDNNLGIMTKGAQNQAGLLALDEKTFCNLIRFVQLHQSLSTSLQNALPKNCLQSKNHIKRYTTQAPSSRINTTDSLTPSVKHKIQTLKNYKAIILEGVPGTGKTYGISKIVEHWEHLTERPVKGTASGNYAITMHPSTSYEDFVEGLRPNGGSENTGQYFHTLTKANKVKKNEGFSYQDGFFKRICKEAAQDPDKDYLVLLDEFNRCNIPKVMGDLLTTLESSKRVPVTDIVKDGLSKAHQTITLPYSKEKFFVPDNVYVIGTMNTTDRSVAPMDSALRRRFAFIRVWPTGFDPKNPTSSDAISKMIVSTLLSDCAQSYLHRSIQLYFDINTKLKKHGPDVLLGHSYLYDLKRFLKDITDEDEGWNTTKMVWDQSISPQLVDSLRKNNLLKLLDEQADLWEVLHEHVEIINQGKGLQRLPTLLLRALPKAENDTEKDSSSPEVSNNNKPD